MTPCSVSRDLAEAWHQKNGFVWLDSLRGESSDEPVEEGLSMIAAEPDLVIEGNAHEWHLLEQELEARKKQHHPRKNPPGAAIGFFRYDGSFYFGFYKKVFRHRSSYKENFSQETKKYYTPTTPATDPISFIPDITSEKYCAMVRKAQAQIAAGNIYQVCLAHRFSAPFTGDPWPFYLALRKTSPAPFSAYLHLGEETILSSSPECFLNINDRHIITQPIKGTRPRQASAEEDARQACELQTSAKETAELVMITDLERNDLGKICEYGSVVTSELLHLKRYPQVFHLVSTVEGKLREEISHVAAVAACFPGGSISGAPKKMAMQVINELEPTPRGLFTGAIGYFGFDGKSQFNIAIRTIVVRNKCATFHVGAGITSDSIPEQEWEETLHKAAGILMASQQKSMKPKNGDGNGSLRDRLS